MERRGSPLLFSVLCFGIAILYVPILVLIGYSFNASPLVNVWGGFSTAWYRELLHNRQLLHAALLSLEVAVTASTGAVVLGTLAAIALVRFARFRGRLLLIIMLPFWTSFLLRVYALEGIIRDTGFLNTVLLRLGLISHPLHIVRTSLAVYLGIIYSYLPFMVLPLFATLEKLDPTLLEAAADLGSTPWRAFLDITLPLSIPGVIAGSMLVFIPAVGEFVIPSLLGGPNQLMIGRVLWDEFFGNHDWPVASAVAIAFLLLLVGPIAIYQYYNVRQLEA